MDNKNNSTKGIMFKTATIGLVAGLLGGGASYYGLSQLNANNTVPSVSVGDSGAKITNTNVKNSGSMTAAFDKVKGAVVSVVNLQRQKENTGLGGLEDFFGEGRSETKKKDANNGELQPSSEGSGVIYMTSGGKGYIVTNNHVVDGSDKLNVILADGKTVPATLVGTDSVTDLAVLTIDAKDVTTTASFGNSKNLVPGQSVIAIGSPLGSEYATSVTQGIISANSRTVNITDDYGRVVSQTTVIQTDTAINPGNSGGPLVDASGQVIGINSMKLSQTSDGKSIEGMGFAIPSDEVVTIINQLVKNGKVSRPQLGVRVGSVSELTAQSYAQLKLPNSVNTGVFIASVEKNSAAANAGLKAKDVIVSADGKKIDGVVSLHSVLYSHKIGDKIPLEIYRNGKKESVNVVLK